MNKKQKKIMWIEDDSTIIRRSVSPLEREGYIIEIVESLEEYHDVKRKINDFELILLDIIIPSNGDFSSGNIGLEILKDIREELKSNIPIIAFTVVNHPDTNDVLKKYDVSDIIYKPTPINIIKEKCMTVMGA